MLIVSRAKAKFLLRGRPLALPREADRYRPGHTYALGVRHGRSLCRVRVMKVTETEMVIVLDPVDLPRLLARHSEHLYVDDSIRAMRHEPEAVSEDEQRRLSQLGTLRWQQELAFRRNSAELKTLGERVSMLEQALSRGEVSVKADLRVIQRRVEQIKKRLREEGAEVQANVG